VNAAELPAYLAAHKPVAFGAAAVGVVGLALWQKRRATAGAPAAGGAVPGTLPAAAVVSPSATGSGGAYDSTSFDLYNALQPEIDQLMATRGPSVTSAPAPVASMLFAPTGSGQLVGFADGSVREVESDGSTYHLSLPELGALTQANGGRQPTITTLPGAAPTSEYSYTANLASKIAGGH
jgi:hypothetical protein